MEEGSRVNNISVGSKVADMVVDNMVSDMLSAGSMVCDI